MKAADLFFLPSAWEGIAISVYEAMASGLAVIPHYVAWPEPLSALIVLQSPRGQVVLGIDEETAAIGRDGAWQVHGRSRVTVWRGRRRERFRAGDAFRL